MNITYQMLKEIADKKNIKKFPDFQTPEICLEAVKQDGNTLKFVKKQTPEICLAAVKQNSNAIQFVDKGIFSSSNGYTMAELEELTGIENIKIIGEK